MESLRSVLVSSTKLSRTELDRTRELEFASKCKLETRQSSSSSYSSSTKNKKSSYELRDRVLSIARELAAVDEPNNMTGWYCQVFMRVGEGKFRACADEARGKSVKYPKRMFGYLLKREMERVYAR